MIPTIHLSVIIPAFNEADRIAATIRALQQQLPAVAGTWEIRVVDDGSTDGTALVVESIAAADPRVTVQREPHLGKGGAVRRGLEAARGSLRFMCDADLSMPVSELARFVAEVPDRYDIAVGTREGVNARRIGEPWIRHATGRVFNWAVRAAGLTRIDDTQCGFKMFSAAAAERIVPWLTVDGWTFDVEMLLVARMRGLRVGQIPIEWHYRERSSVRIVRDGLRMLRDLARIRRNARAGRYADGVRA